MGLLTVGHDGALDDGAEDLGALGEAQSLETTANGVNEAQPGRLEGKGRLDLEAVDIVCNVLEDLVGLWADGGLSVVGRHGSGKESSVRSAYR